ncbi:MAG: zinc-dependent alcohol dehydrogenase family protein [Candidatus Dormibacteria bacterium]
MRAMVLEQQGAPLRAAGLRRTALGAGQVRIEVSACALCRTDLHVLDGQLPDPKLPLVLGHQVVGRIMEVGDGVTGVSVGDRVGVPWLAWTDGTCQYCRAGRENLCRDARFTGYTVDGGYAEETVAHAAACLRLPDGYDDLQVAPLLCAGLIGFRAYRFTGDAQRLGLYGFGAAAHILTQIALHAGKQVYAFTRAGDDASQRFARELGAVWAGDAMGPAPELLDAAIIFAPAGDLVPAALRAVRPAGVVVCGGIHTSDIPSFPYSILWEERVVRSVANLTHADGVEFLRIAPRVPVRTHVEVHPLEDANDALQRLRVGAVQGASVLSMA